MMLLPIIYKCMVAELLSLGLCLLNKLNYYNFIYCVFICLPNFILIFYHSHCSLSTEP